MNRVELIEKLVADNELSKAAAGRFLDTLIDTIQTTVKEGDTVALIGFGTFKAVKRAARTGKNPRSGEPINIPAGTVPKFTAGANFKAVVDPKAAARQAAKAAKPAK
jgi:DNA-binding protein HU-beta